MNKYQKYRLILLSSSMIIITILGYYITKSFHFMIEDYWFVSGLLLVILISLVDQPFFSTESNIFLNSVTAFISLVLIEKSYRTATWVVFFSISLFILMTSYSLIWLRKNPIRKEPTVIQLLNLIVTKIGRPEILFSALFIWGLIRKFTLDSINTNIFLLFWGIFIVFNLPSVSRRIMFFSKEKKLINPPLGIVREMIHPDIAFVEFLDNTELELGCTLDFYQKNKKLCSGIFIENRYLKSKHIGKIAIRNKEINFFNFSIPNSLTLIKESDNPIITDSGIAISIVDKGTELGYLNFLIVPSFKMSEGEIVWVYIDNVNKGFYQIISAKLIVINENDENKLFYTQVIAGQLGKWNNIKCIFEPINWVPQAGEIIFRSNENTIPDPILPNDRLLIGNVPNSKFPVHINIEDTVTHNTAIIGVTGSGKSYLAFHIIEVLSQKRIKVLVLDISRQHWVYLSKNNNTTAIHTKNEIQSWYNGDSQIGIYQYANESSSYPRATADFVMTVFDLVSSVTLRAGTNEPAKICIVFEEAHSLIPEWNQVSQSSDTNQVNRTARYLLQGRKFGMGCILISQRTANVTKTILNQCNSIIALQSFDQTGLDFLSNYMGEEYAKTISTLPKQNAVLVGKSSSSSHPILFKITNLEERYNDEES